MVFKKLRTIQLQLNFKSAIRRGGWLFLFIIYKENYKSRKIANAFNYADCYFGFGGLIIIWAPCVAGCINQGMPGAAGFKGRPVVSGVAYGI